MKLTSEEINVLTEALDDWVDSGSEKMIVHGLMTSMLVKDEEKAKSMMEKESDKHNQQREYRKIAATKLKAKLYEFDEQMNLEGVLQGETALV